MSDATARLSSALGERYLVERELGSGGMATVYLAEDLKHHPRLALILEKAAKSAEKVAASAAAAGSL